MNEILSFAAIYTELQVIILSKRRQIHRCILILFMETSKSVLFNTWNGVVISTDWEVQWEGDIKVA